MEDVRLPELEVIQRYSIAVRQEFAPADEVIAALKADLEAIVKASKPRARAATKTSSRSRAASKTSSRSRTAAKKKTTRRR